MTGGPNDDLDFSYPYHPSVVAEAIFLATFFVYGAIFTYQAIKYKKYYILMMALFACAEGGGYIARLLFAEKYELKNTYLSQIIILVLSPNIIQAYMYTATADLITWSNLDPATWFKRHGPHLPTYFILTDFLCLVIQGAAGGIMGSPNATQQDVDNGRIVILIGLILQLASLTLFVFVLVYFVRAAPEVEKDLMKDYLNALYIGITLVVIRNIYRVAEFAEGSMTSGAFNEKEVYVLLADAVAMWISCFFFAYWSMGTLPENQKYDPVGASTPVDKAQKVVVSSKHQKEVELPPSSSTSEEV